MGMAPGGLPAAMEGIIPRGILVTHNLPLVAHASQTPCPNQPTKTWGQTRTPQQARAESEERQSFGYTWHQETVKNR